MKRDMDLIREILILIEDHDGDPWSLGDDRNDNEIKDKDRERFSYHVMILHQGGYVHAIDCSTPEQFEWKPVYLTWQGHEFLDAIRDPEVWKKTKNGALAAGGFTFDLLKELAKGYLKKQIADRTGVEI